MDYKAHSVFQKLHDYSSLSFLSLQNENEHHCSFAHTQSQNASPKGQVFFVFILTPHGSTKCKCESEEKLKQ
jgi:hypothetical protein